MNEPFGLELVSEVGPEVLGRIQGLQSSHAMPNGIQVLMEGGALGAGLEMFLNRLGSQRIQVSIHPQ